MREIVYDTETTGRSHQTGHRIVEIAAVELIDGQPTGRTFHSLINPQRSIPADVVKVHGITDEKVANAPTFRQIMPDFLEFVRGAKMIAHNASFDEGFINNELKLAGQTESLWSFIDESIDTIVMSRKIWVGKEFKHSLDALLDRLDVDRSERTLHGALLDSTLLAQAYVQMRALLIARGPTLEDDVPPSAIRYITPPRGALPSVSVSANELAAHGQIMDTIRPKSTPPRPGP